MPYPVAREKVVLQGNTPLGDIWNCGFHTGSWSALSDGDATTLATAICSEFGSAVLNGTSSGIWSDNTNITKVTGYQYNASGVLTRVSEGNDPASGPSTANPLPDEVAVCVSLLSATAGRSGKGRMYLPAPTTAAVGGVGEFTSGALDDLADDCQSFLDSVNTALDTAGIVVGVSVFSTVLLGLLPIRNIRVGNTFDAQRRRRNAYSESYESRALAP